jgi:hypothetical protein
MIMSELIDRGTYYEIKDYKSYVSPDGTTVVNCPYIPKFLVDNKNEVSRDYSTKS